MKPIRLGKISPQIVPLSEIMILLTIKIAPMSSSHSKLVIMLSVVLIRLKKIIVCDILKFKKES